MAERDIYPHIIDQAFLDRLSRDLDVRGSLGNYLALNPQIQPTLDVARYLSGELEARDVADLTSIDVSNLINLVDGLNDRTFAAPAIAANAYVSRVTETAGAENLRVNRSYVITGGSIAADGGIAVFQNQDADHWPGGIYALDVLVSSEGDETVAEILCAEGWTESSDSPGAIFDLVDVHRIGVLGGDQNTVNSVARHNGLIQIRDDQVATIIIRSRIGWTSLAQSTFRISFNRITASPLDFPIF